MNYNTVSEEDGYEKVNQNWKQNILKACLVSIIVASMMIQVIFGFLPIFVAKNFHGELNEAHVGFLLGVFSMA
jgi:hypothetical protein